MKRVQVLWRGIITLAERVELPVNNNSQFMKEHGFRYCVFLEEVAVA